MPTRIIQTMQELERERGITEVACRQSVTQISVPLSNGTEELVDVLRALEAAKLNVSLVKVHSGPYGTVPVAMNFVVEDDIDLARVQRVVKRPARAIRHCTIIMLKSSAMRMMHGIMADAVKALYAKNIEVHATSDSYDCLSLVIDDKHTRSAVATLKKQFGLSA